MTRPFSEKCQTVKFILWTIVLTGSASRTLLFPDRFLGSDRYVGLTICLNAHRILANLDAGLGYCDTTETRSAYWLRVGKTSCFVVSGGYGQVVGGARETPTAQCSRPTRYWPQTVT